MLVRGLVRVCPRYHSTPCVRAAFSLVKPEVMDAESADRQTHDSPETAMIASARTIEKAAWVMEIERVRIHCEELRVRLLAQSKPTVDAALKIGS